MYLVKYVQVFFGRKASRPGVVGIYSKARMDERGSAALMRMCGGTAARTPQTSTLKFQ